MAYINMNRRVLLDNDKEQIMTQSAVDPKMIQAYRETEYCVLGDNKFMLKVDQFNNALMAAHKQYSVDCSTFITAYNPYSQTCDTAQNVKLNQRLSDELQASGLSFIDAIGQHPQSTWPGENSFFVLGLTLSAAKILGARYQQNAIICCGQKAVPQLIMLK
jgi:hypothetical protein